LFKQFASTVGAQGAGLVRFGVILGFTPRAKPFVIRLGDLAFGWHTNEDTSTQLYIQAISFSSLSVSALSLGAESSRFDVLSG
jgi:hypothetical protein